MISAVFLILFISCAVAQNRMDMCYITIKNFETEGLSPMDVQRAADGVMIEINYKGNAKYKNEGCNECEGGYYLDLNYKC